jgi:hypothetical protein
MPWPFDAVREIRPAVADLDRDQIKPGPEYQDSREVVAIVTVPRSKEHDIASDTGW